MSNLLSNRRARFQGAAVAVFLLVSGCGVPQADVAFKSSAEATLEGVATTPSSQWPPFDATFTEQTFPSGIDPADLDEVADSTAATGPITGFTETWEFQWRANGEWSMRALDGNTYGGVHADGSRAEIHALPGATKSFSGGYVTLSEPDDGQVDSYQEKDEAPSFWLQSRYSPTTWVIVRTDITRQTITMTSASPSGCVPPECDSVYEATLNEFGIPIEFSEFDGAGQLLFHAYMSDFTVTP